MPAEQTHDDAPQQKSRGTAQSRGIVRSFLRFPLVVLRTLVGGSADPNRITIWQFPKAIFAWPLCFLSLLCLLLYNVGVNPEWLAWGQFAMLVGVILALALDVDIHVLAVFGLLLLVGLFCGLWMTYAFNIPVFQNIYALFRDLDLQFNEQTAFLWFILGALLFAYSLGRVLYDGRWNMTSNELQHQVLFRRRRAFARGAKTVEAEFPDLIEWILGFGAGTLIVRDSRSRQVINRIPNVLALSSKVSKMDRLLELREVVQHRGEDVPEDDDEQQEGR